MLDADHLEALVEVLLIAAYADGEMSSEERAHFTESATPLTGGQLPGGRLDALVGSLSSGLTPGRLASLWPAQRGRNGMSARIPGSSRVTRANPGSPGRSPSRSERPARSVIPLMSRRRDRAGSA